MTSTTYCRPATHFFGGLINNRYRVSFIDGSEGTGICCVSIRDIRSVEPGVRIKTRPGSAQTTVVRDDEEVAGERGLTLYGTHKWDRPTLAQMEQINPAHAELFRRAIAAEDRGGW